MEIRSKLAWGGSRNRKGDESKGEHREPHNRESPAQHLSFRDVARRFRARGGCERRYTMRPREIRGRRGEKTLDNTRNAAQCARSGSASQFFLGLGIGGWGGFSFFRANVRWVIRRREGWYFEGEYLRVSSIFFFFFLYRLHKRNTYVKGRRRERFVRP